MDSANTYVDTFAGVSITRHGDKDRPYDDKVKDASMDLMLRMPAATVPKNLNAVTSLIADEDLRDVVQLKTDQPLDIAMDDQEGKEFLKCEYNKDGDSYRSPWTNQYFPPIVVEAGEEEPMYPSTELLQMEQKANHVFERYAKLYYDSNYLTSVFFFDTDNNGFGSCWLVKKSKFPISNF